jgi:hypothetical protein
MEVRVFDPPINPKRDPKLYERKTPHELFVRRGRSPFWFCFVTECLQCGVFFNLTWPTGLDHVLSDSLVHVECPNCSFEFTKTAHRLIQSWTLGDLRIGKVRRIEPCWTAQ